jgi:hypothetical protein
MISRATIQKLIDDVEAEFRKCWRTLAALKEGTQPKTPVNEILDFQAQLAETLFRLDETYRLICKEKEETIKKKRRLNPDWFRRKMKSLAAYQDVIKIVIGIGRALGDSFAWFFYQRERNLLSKHLRRDRIDHTPPGIGGKGELEFVNRVRHINGKLVLYHGITTFLRIGDFSLIDLRSLTVRAIGELKTTRVSKDQLLISATLVTSKPFRIKGESKAERPTTIENFPAVMEERFRKQIRVMGDSVTQKEPDSSMRSWAKFHYSALKNLAVALEKKSVAYQQAGSGLMLIGLRTRRSGSTLASDLLGKPTFDLDRRLRKVEDHLVKIFVTEKVPGKPNDNALLSDELNLETLRGTIPVFWWPVPITFLEKLFFHRVVIISVYNPAHLLARIRALGFEVETLEKAGKSVPVYRITKIFGKSQFEMRLNDFLRTMQRALVAEEGIIRTVLSILKEAEAGRIPRNVHVDLDMQYVYQGALRPRRMRKPRKKHSAR